MVVSNLKMTSVTTHSITKCECESNMPIFDSNPKERDTLYRVSQEECTKLRESVPYVKLYRYNPKHLYPKLNGYGDNGQRILKL